VIGGAARAPRAELRDPGPPAARLVAWREAIPGLAVAELHAPWIAVGARAGQTVHLRVPGEELAILRRAAPISAADPGTGTVAIHVRDGTPGAAALGRIPIGGGVEAWGPFGRPFELDPRSRHLLLVAEGRDVGALRFLADEAIRDGRQVTLAMSAGTAREVYPTRLLPDELEVVVATRDGSLGREGGVLDLVPDLEAWADQAFAAGPIALLSELAGLAATRRQRLGVALLGRKRGGGRPDPAGSTAARRRAWLQVVLESPLACAAAVCLGCAVPGSAGASLRVCREGPVFAADELEWEPEGGR